MVDQPTLKIGALLLALASCTRLETAKKAGPAPSEPAPVASGARAPAPDVPASPAQQQRGTVTPYLGTKTHDGLERECASGVKESCELVGMHGPDHAMRVEPEGYLRTERRP